jgi:uncharacterized protein YbjT (DUF2867 family)
MTVLVTAGTGTVGSHLVPRLLAAGEQVRVLTRDSDRAARLLPAGADLAEGDLLDPYAARRHFTGISQVFLAVAACSSETQQGLTAVELARRSGVERIVYMSTHKVELTPRMPVGGGTKLPIERAVRESGLQYTFLRPNSFFQNDRWYLPDMITHGLYHQPLGHVGMSRVDARDVADAATTALTRDGFHGRGFSIVGPDVNTGPSIAEAWSRGLGRKVVYADDDLEAYARYHAFNPPDSRFNYGLFFEFYQEHGLVATPGELRSQEELLRHPPRTLAGYVAETAATVAGHD